MQQQKPLNAPLLNLNLEDAKNALEISRKIHMYMGASKPIEENQNTIHFILQKGLSTPTLRDEVCPTNISCILSARFFVGLKE